MKIKFALIASEHIDKAQDLSAKLQNAVEVGEFNRVEQITRELISLVHTVDSLNLSEEYWRQLLEKIRSFDASFKSNYIIAKSQLEVIAAGIADSFKDVFFIVEQALKSNSIVLQLPFEEENADG